MQARAAVSSGRLGTRRATRAALVRKFAERGRRSISNMRLTAKSRVLEHAASRSFGRVAARSSAIAGIGWTGMAKIQSRMVAAWALMHFVLYAALATHDYFAHPYLGFRKRILIGPLLQLALALAFALGVARARVALIVVSVITTYLWSGSASNPKGSKSSASITWLRERAAFGNCSSASISPAFSIVSTSCCSRPRVRGASPRADDFPSRRRSCRASP